MKKRVFQRLVLSVFYILSVSMFGMQPDENSIKHKVKMYHCTSSGRAQQILAEGLKSRAQLAKEGKDEVYEMPFSDHYENIYFQYIDPSGLRQIGPRLWQRVEGLVECSYCVAIDVNPDETVVHNPDLRLNAPFSQYLGPLLSSYNASGLTLTRYLAARNKLEQADCAAGCFAIPHPLTAEPLCIPVDKHDNYTGYYWNEYTIRTDRIDPNQFAQ